MPTQRVRLTQIQDFSGGLNVNDDAFQLPGNESPSMLNVRLMPMGGFERRGTLGVLNGSSFTAGNLRNIFSFFGNGVQQIVVQNGDDIAYSTGGSSFTTVNPDALTLTGAMRAAAMARVSSANSERLYISRNAETSGFRFDGAATAVLGDATLAFNDTIGSPAGGKLPRSRYLKAHAGYLFHGYIVEGGGVTTYKSRIRWSHPGEPEDYRTNDFIDVGVDDGDFITGLSSFGEKLYIFKNRSIWVLSGYATTNFALRKLTDTIGAVGQEAIVKTPDAIYFFDGIRGVFRLRDNGSVEWLWSKLDNLLHEGTIPAAYTSGITMSWMDNRVWCAVPWGSATVNTRMFVFDPLVGRHGAWYVYQYGTDASPIDFGPMMEWRPNATTVFRLGVGRGGRDVYKFDDTTSGPDVLNATGTTGNWSSYYATSWFAAGLPGVQKRWRRPSFVLDADVSATIGVQVYTDYTSLAPKHTQQLSVTANTLGGGTWGTSTWGAFTWGPNPEGEQAVVRGSGFGRALAVQLKFDGPVDTRWGLNSFDLRFIPQRIR